MRLRDAALAGAAALGALAMVNQALARRAERRHPPRGRFVTVNGVRLHVTDRGAGPAVVLIHGNAVTGEDFDTSGVTERLLPHYRVIVIDRPGFGHSDRPRGRSWTAGAQAALLDGALAALGVERPVLVGHSWGAIVALSLAARHAGGFAGLVLISGYYLPTLRPDVLLVAPVAVPGLGDVLRHTVSPWAGWVLMPLLKRSMFAPRPVPPRFRAEYSDAMALRPSQIRATATDGALMIPGAMAQHDDHARLDLPVVILAGAGDRVVFPRNARRLHARVPGSILHVIDGVGHMLHHAVPDRVAAVVEAMTRGRAALPRAA